MNNVLKGMMLGLSIAAPVGPIALLCIRRTLANGRLSGFVSGLGAALAHTVYGSVAAFGLTAVSSVLLTHQNVVRLVGGIFLIYLGIKTYMSKSKQAAQGAVRTTLMSDCVSTFFITLTNPMTILLFTAAFAGLDLVSLATGYGAALTLVGGVFFGSAGWWLVLSMATGFFKVTEQGIMLINKISGSILVGFGLWVLLWGVVKNIVLG